MLNILKYYASLSITLFANLYITIARNVDILDVQSTLSSYFMI